jgi:hypothetical protein
MVSARSTFCEKHTFPPISLPADLLPASFETTHLSTPVLGNALQRLEHSLAGQLQSSTTTTDGHEIIISLLPLGTISTSGLSRLSGLADSLLVLVSRSRRSSDSLFISRLKRLGVLRHQSLTHTSAPSSTISHTLLQLATHLLVLFHSRLKLPQLLLNLLLHPVQSLCVGRVHLLLAVLFLSANVGDLSVHIDDRLDEQGRSLGGRRKGRSEGLVSSNKSSELVEF